MSPTADPAALAALLAKYQKLLRLRRAREAGEPLPERALFVELATAFPGALYELEHLTLAELSRRVEALGLARSGAPAPWMVAQLGFHELLRAGLAHRRGEPEPAEAVPWVDDRFRQEIAQRTVRLVTSAVRALARQHGVEEEQIRAWILRPRRPA